MSSSSAILFGICGSISAYKSLDVIRLLKSNTHITPILSSSATKFVTTWSVETLAENELLSNDVENGKIVHLEALKEKALFAICPASANTIAKLAAGIADDMLSASFLSYTGKRILFPAMHTEMYENSITKSNIEALKKQGVVVITPDQGDLACGDMGVGRLPHPECIAQVIKAHCQHPSLSLQNTHVVITAGGTSEAIDPVRSITNHASGLSGHALANIAYGFGAKVTLIRTIKHPVFSGVSCIDVTTAAELSSALMSVQSDTDILFMNAAVSDFTTQQAVTKQARSNQMKLELTPTEDILKAFNLSKPSHCISIGYCLSDASDIIPIANEKLKKKQCDFIIANTPKNFGQPFRSIAVIDASLNHKNISGSLSEISSELLHHILNH